MDGAICLRLNQEELTMSTEQDRVHVEDGLCSHCAVHVKRVHHRDFPEIQAECGTVPEGVAHLALMLATDRDGARSGWHREAIDRAIDDVRRYLDALDEAGGEGGESCR